MVEAERMLLEVCLPKEQFLIILDGLDECSEQLDGSETRQHPMRFLNLAAKDARVLVASRHLADIDAGLCCTQFEIRAPEANLRNYVAERLAGLEMGMHLAAGLTHAVVENFVIDDVVLYASTQTINDSSPALADLDQFSASTFGHGHPGSNRYQKPSPDQEISRTEVFGSV